MRLMAFVLCLGFCSAVVSAPVPFDHQPQSPYEWNVYVKFKPHVRLTLAVRQQLLKDLKASLGPALGDDLGKVVVQDLADLAKDKRDPLVQAFDDKDFSVLGTDKFRTLTGVKSHFLTVEVKDGKFLLQSCQHDGDTGLATPQVRTQTVADLDTLSRTAGLMLVADFGPTATVEPLADNKEACLLRLRGMELPGVKRWLKKGDVFMMSVILDEPKAKDPKAPPLKPGQTLDVPKERKARPMSATLLRVLDIIESTNGTLKYDVAKCEIFTIYETAFPKSARLVGYRAMKLSTQDAPVRVQLTDGDNKLPGPAVPLEIWATEYGGLATKPTPQDTLEGRNGLYKSGRNMRGIAYVWVKLGNEKSPYVLPVLTASGPNPIKFEFKEENVRKARFQDRVERFSSKVLDARLAQEQLGLALGALIQKAENKKALERTEGGLKTLDENEKELNAQLKELRADESAKDAKTARELTAAEQLLKGLVLVKPELESKREDLKLSLEKADNPVEYEKKFRANEITRLITFHERRGEIAEALDQYDRLFETTGLEEAKTRKAKLEADSAPKSPAVAAARVAARIEWAMLEKLDEISAKVPALAKTADELAKADDKYGLRIAQTTIQSGYARLGDLVGTLDPELIQDKEQVKAIAQVKLELMKIEEVVTTNRKRLMD